MEFFSCVVYVGIHIPPLNGVGLFCFCKLLPRKFPDKVKNVLNESKKRTTNNDRDNVRIHFSFKVTVKRLPN